MRRPALVVCLLLAACSDDSGAYRWHTHFQRWNSYNIARGLAVGDHIVVTGQIPSTMYFDGHRLPGWADDVFVLGLAR